MVSGILRYLSPKTISGRLMFIIAGSVSIAVLVTLSATTLRGVQRAQASQAEIMRANAAVFAAATSDYIAEGNRAGTLRVLRGLEGLPAVTVIRVYTPDGETFAQLGFDIALRRETRSLWSSLGLDFSVRNQRQEARVPIRQGGRDIGELVLTSNTDALASQLQRELTFAIFMALGASITASLVAVPLLGSVTRPLRRLSFVLNRARRTGRLPDKVTPGQDYETRVLVGSFNAMIEQIAKRDRRIGRHQEELERAIETRTRELRLAKEQADRANAAKSDFLATMSHEIRTPLNGVIVMADLLAKSRLPRQHRRRAEVIAQSGSSLLAVINDVLDLSKIESGRLDLERTSLSPGRLVEDVTTLFFERAREKNVDLAVYTAPDVPEQIFGDTTRLRQVLSNVINNALKFTDTGGVLVRVETGASFQDDDDASAVSMIVTVIDTGPGIPADKLDTIFGAFAQADQSTTRRYGGTGLGLAICRRLMTAMGGTVKAENGAEGGAIFTIRWVAEVASPSAFRRFAHAPRIAVRAKGYQSFVALRDMMRDRGFDAFPLGARGERSAQYAIAPPEALEDPPLSRCEHIICLAPPGSKVAEDAIMSGHVSDLISSPFGASEIDGVAERIVEGTLRGAAALTETDEGLGTAPCFTGLRVLAADDTIVNREVLADAMDLMEARILTVEDGSKAVDAFEMHNYDIIFLDLAMPVMDGYGAARAIRQIEQERGDAPIPIVALSAAGIDEAGPGWREAGMTLYLQKPFTLDGLAETIASLGFEPERRIPKQEEPEAPAIPVATESLLDASSLSTLLALEKKRPGTIEKVMGLYRVNAPIAVAAVEAAEDTESLRLAAHALKSMSLSAGARSIADLSGRIEKAAREGQRLDGAVDVLAESLGACLLAMEQWQGNNTVADVA